MHADLLQNEKTLLFLTVSLGIRYVERLKEQLGRLGKGMEQKERSCNIFRRNVVEERLRIHSVDDSLKKLRTNANPTTASDQELINATQQEALQVMFN